MRWLVMNHRERSAWALMPEFLRRVREFSARVDGTVEAALLSELLTLHFVVDQPTVLGLLLLDPDADTARGHILLQLEESYGAKRVSVPHVEMDAGMPEEMIEPGLAVLEEIGRKFGATALHGVALTPSRARLFRQRFGFSDLGAVCKRPIAPLAQPGEVR